MATARIAHSCLERDLIRGSNIPRGIVEANLFRKTDWNIRDCTA